MAVELVTLGDFKELFNYFTKTSYQAKKVDAFGTSVQEKCEKLFAKDYRFSIVSNTNGELCNTYPSRIVFLEGENGNPPVEDSEKPNEENNNINDATRFREQVSKSRFARCRTRFPVPVILLDGKYICRSSTLACGKEIYPRMSFDYFFPDETTDADRENVNVVDEYEEIDVPTLIVDPVVIEPDQSDEDSKVGEYRNHDVQLLRDLSVTNICDLMMEDRKVKLGMYVTSSEKADRHNRYKDFAILGMPYPGCEFFLKFREFDYHGERMKFDWTQSYIKRKLELPSDSFTSFGIDWAQYKEWDLDTLTQNYMKVLVKYINEGTSSMLIHCISGWDRTPLFISMLRMSLWADGKVHCSLTALEMMYLTVGYDWFLFGHQLGCRLSKREEIMKYCFYCLKFLTPPDFSVLKIENGHNGEKHPNSPFESDGKSNFTAQCNNISANNGDVDMVKNTNIWYSEDYGCDPTSSPHRNRPTSSTPEKNELCSSVDSSEDLSLLRCNTPPLLVQSREDGLPFSIPPPDVHSTSPLAVPSSSRQRTESSSSDFSYLIISGTGSIPLSTSPRSSISSPPPELNRSRRLHENSEKSTAEVPPEVSVLHLREEKLNELRQIFLNTYFSAVNVRFKSGSGSGIVGLFNQYAEKVGFRTPKAPS